MKLLKGKYNFLFLLVCLLFGFFLYTSPPLQAKSLKKEINKQVQEGSGFDKSIKPQKPQVLAARIIKVVLTLVGTVFIVLLLVAAYNLATSRGETDKIEKAQKTALRATVGLIIVIMAYSITVLVTTAILSSAGAGKYNYPPGKQERLRISPF